ncbi:YbhB/YbcL family Raf kinase inhibitor-like protein [Halorussus litoreus]|uniref:YbhB/YbcL family Raf kinase inhibitor-like protein n=1 Tax=Halorussus litoreus TaxID=1710536 RepID=UPI000E263295|nr:YbhB/YbcL family Raf kinase inhibitor-like protein [Halorussus litoreus]
MRRRTLLRSAAVAATIGGAGVVGAGGNRGGQETTTGAQQTTTEDQQTTEQSDAAEQTTTAEGEFSIRSPAWENGETIPTEYTCEGANVSPPLSIANPPERTEAFALVMDDPDAPNPPFVHWLLWNVPGDAREIPEGVPAEETVESLDGTTQGANGTGELGYIGPCPPRGDPQHTYLFELYALESPLDLDPGAAYEEVLNALFPVAIARARYVGQYERGEATTTP